MSVAIAGGGDELLANPGDLLVPGDVLNPSLPYPLTAANADGANVPVITTAGDYKYVGKLVVGFDQAGNVIAVDETASGPLRVSGVALASFVSVVPSIPPVHFKEILENAVSRIPLADGRFAQGRGLRVHLRRLRAGARGGQRRQRPHSRIRVKDITLDDGTPIVMNGIVVAGAPSVSIATNDFSARGGDQYPFRGAPFTTIGVTYQQALSNYIQGLLGVLITTADYPEGGEGRITRLN